MAFERWGSLSVRDHITTNVLITGLILYDRIIIPTWMPNDDLSEWQGSWNSEAQRKRLIQLGDLAVPRPWNESRRQKFSERIAELRQEREDAEDMVKEVQDELPYQLTRRILAQESPGSLPHGVSHVDVVPAYPSEAALKADFLLTNDTEDVSELGLLIGQRLAIPSGLDIEETLKRTIQLVRNSEFRERRRQLFSWQRDAFRDGYNPETAIAELELLVKRFNDEVGKATGDVYWRLAFTVGGAALTLAAAPGSMLVGAAALLGLVTFATLDRKPVVQQGEASPAAVFYDVNTTLNVNFSAL
jgi:hypothetical protein